MSKVYLKDLNFVLIYSKLCLNFLQISSETIDWMHNTARCLGYPSDSSRAARERAQDSEATCSRHLRWTGQERPGWVPPPLAFAASLLALWLTSSPMWLASLSPGRRRALPTSHWPWVSSRAAYRRAGSPPLPSTSACSGATSGWHGCG